MNKRDYFRRIPNVNGLLHSDRMKELAAHYGKESVKKQLQMVLADLRSMIEQEDVDMFEDALTKIEDLTEAYLKKVYQPSIRKVINATGTVLHTNLGRAPISEKHLSYLTEVACGYSNLEYNLDEGKRGERYAHFEKLLCEITGAEAAMAVNNNAAAVLLTLSALASGGEMIVSRGELIEIGGKFRIPDVCAQSGSILREVGTTNKTHRDDYESAINENTKVLFKAHTSNYRILGFTESVDAQEMVQIARTCMEREIPVIEDMGSGALIDFSTFGLPKEPTVQEEILKGVDIVTFSGDKLLGGPQAGIICGKKRYIDQIKKHPLTRALRIDKFTVTALELILREYQSETKALENIPTLKMLTMTKKELEEIAEHLYQALQKESLPCSLAIIHTESSVGGGSMPLAKLESRAIALKPNQMSVSVMEEKLHRLAVPILVRILDDCILLDVRTIFDKDIPIITKGFRDILL